MECPQAIPMPAGPQVADLMSKVSHLSAELDGARDSLGLTWPLGHLAVSLLGFMDFIFLFGRPF